MSFVAVVLRLLALAGLASWAGWVSGHPDVVAALSFPVALLCDVILGAARALVRGQFSADRLAQTIPVKLLGIPVALSWLGTFNSGPAVLSASSSSFPPGFQASPGLGYIVAVVVYLEAARSAGYGSPVAIAALAALAAVSVAASLPLWRDAERKAELFLVDAGLILSRRPLPPITT